MTAARRGTGSPDSKRSLASIAVTDAPVFFSRFSSEASQRIIWPQKRLYGESLPRAERQAPAESGVGGKGGGAALAVLLDGEHGGGLAVDFLGGMHGQHGGTGLGRAQSDAAGEFGHGVADFLAVGGEEIGGDIAEDRVGRAEGGELGDEGRIDLGGGDFFERDGEECGQRGFVPAAGGEGILAADHEQPRAVADDLFEVFLLLGIEEGGVEVAQQDDLETLPLGGRCGQALQIVTGLQAGHLETPGDGLHHGDEHQVGILLQRAAQRADLRPHAALDIEHA